MMDFNELLELMCEKKASDLFISAGIPPSMKVNGKITPVSSNILNAEEAKKMIFKVMPNDQKRHFERFNEANFAISPKQLGRFRVNVFRHQSQVGMVLRRIETEIPTINDLHLPELYKEIAMYRQGLVLIIGATGVGKSTTLASMIDHRNRHNNGHIITIEDPIEFVHDSNLSIVTQREVGLDTDSFEIGLKNALRQAPDVIVVGEIRSKETMMHALQFAETGHLCIATLHASNTNQVFDRIISFFPDEQRKQISLDLSLALKAVIAQRLVPTRDGKRRRAAVECLLNTPLVANRILNNEISDLPNIIKKSDQLGMVSFDQSLYDLFEEGEISYEEALKHAESANELRLRIKLNRQHERQHSVSQMLNTITLIEED